MRRSTWRSPTHRDSAVFNYGRDAVADATGELPGENAADPTTTVATTSTSTTSAATSTSAAPASTTSSTTTSTSLPPTLPADSLYSVLPGGGTIGGGSGDDGDGEAAEDAFSNHWFSDSGAWLDVVLWGALTTAVVVGAYLLAKRLRNSWIGLAAGCVPFVIALYFFYQNVNRLLPAAL